MRIMHKTLGENAYIFIIDIEGFFSKTIAICGNLSYNIVVDVRFMVKGCDHSRSGIFTGVCPISNRALSNQIPRGALVQSPYFG